MNKNKNRKIPTGFLPVMPISRYVKMIHSAGERINREVRLMVSAIEETSTTAYQLGYCQNMIPRTSKT